MNYVASYTYTFYDKCPDSDILFTYLSLLHSLHSLMGSIHEIQNSTNNSWTKVITTVKRLKRRAHINDLFASMKILKFADVVDYFHAVYVFKSLNNIEDNNYFHRRT